MDIALTDYLRFLVALVFVLGLILGAALLAKRFGLGNQAPMRVRGTKRLAIVESVALDTRHRMMLIRRDDKEHLIVIGGNSELVVESGITASQPAAAEVGP
jgi:flagellar protein FliO/FliZ